MISFSNFASFFAETIKLNADDVKAPMVGANSGTITTLLTTVYIWAGIVCVIVMIVGGFRYITSNGDSGGIQSAKNTILYGVIGLIVIIGASALTSFIVGRF